MTRLVLDIREYGPGDVAQCYQDKKLHTSDRVHRAGNPVVLNILSNPKMAVLVLIGIGALVGLTYLILTVGWRGKDFPPGKLADQV